MRGTSCGPSLTAGHCPLGTPGERRDWGPLKLRLIFLEKSGVWVTRWKALNSSGLYSPLVTQESHPCYLGMDMAGQKCLAPDLSNLVRVRGKFKDVAQPPHSTEDLPRVIHHRDEAKIT